MTRVLFFGDMASSGFGSVTMDLGRAMLARGLDVRFVSQNDIGVVPEPFTGRTVALSSFLMEPDGVSGVRDFVPGLLDGTAKALLADGSNWDGWKPDACILLGDFTAARIFALPYLPWFQALPTFHYVPIEGIDLPPRWADLWKTLTPVAMSRFGQEQIALVTGTLPPLAYHGVDRSYFRPVSPSDPIVIEADGQRDVLTSRDACKRWFGINPKARVVLRTDRNMPRKRYAALFRAMTPVLHERPDTALVLHCMAHDQGGFLHDSTSKMPLHVQQQVRITDARDLSREMLAALYNMADLYVSTSAEGFGLTIAEALSCGTPAVGLDYSAVPEVIGPAGVVVPVGTLYDNEYDHMWAAPDEGRFGDAVAFLLDHPAKRRALGAEGPRHIERSFRWEACAAVFHEAITGALQGRDAILPPEAGDYVFVPPEAVVERELVAV